MAFQPGAFQYPGFQVQRVGAGNALLPSLTGTAEGEVVVPKGDGLAILPNLTAGAQGVIPVVGVGNATLPSLTGRGEVRKRKGGGSHEWLPDEFYFRKSKEDPVAVVGVGRGMLPSITKPPPGWKFTDEEIAEILEILEILNLAA